MAAVYSQFHILLSIEALEASLWGKVLEKKHILEKEENKGRCMCGSKIVRWGSSLG